VLPAFPTYANSGLLAQLTLTLVTLAVTRVPAPFETVQACPLGWVATVTAKLPSSGTGLLNVNGPLPSTVNASLPLSFSLSCVPEASPETVPPTVKVEEPALPGVVPDGADGNDVASALPAELTVPPQPVITSVVTYIPHVEDTIWREFRR
jgi:hypothetical protein